MSTSWNFSSDLIFTELGWKTVQLRCFYSKANSCFHLYLWTKRLSPPFLTVCISEYCDSVKSRYREQIIWCEDPCVDAMCILEGFIWSSSDPADSLWLEFMRFTLDVHLLVLFLLEKKSQFVHTETALQCKPTHSKWDDQEVYFRFKLEK